MELSYLVDTYLNKEAVDEQLETLRGLPIVPMVGERGDLQVCSPSPMLYFQTDSLKLRTAVSDGDTLSTYGRTPELIRYSAIRLVAKMYPQVGDSSQQEDLIAQAIVSEKTDNYSYKLDPQLLRERIEAGVNSTGDVEVDSILSQMIDEIPLYIGFA